MIGLEQIAWGLGFTAFFTVVAVFPQLNSLASRYRPLQHPEALRPMAIALASMFAALTFTPERFWEPVALSAPYLGLIAWAVLRTPLLRFASPSTEPSTLLLRLVRHPLGALGLGSLLGLGVGAGVRWFMQFNGYSSSVEFDFGFYSLLLASAGLGAWEQGIASPAIDNREAIQDAWRLQHLPPAPERSVSSWMSSLDE